jgi:cytochrome c-type biogenesis protein CcmH
MRRLLLLIVSIVGLAAPALALDPGEMLADPALEARARALSKTLRCMVCQNQSIDDSDAPLAHDLRVLVRERLAAGDSDAQVRDFLVARYGEFVLLEPRLRPATAILWAVPILVLVLGGAAVFFGLKRRPAGVPADLSPEEKRRLAELSGGSSDLTKV